MRVQLSTNVDAAGGHWLTIRALSDDGDGVSSPIPWAEAWGPEHLIVMKQPDGGYKMSHKVIKARSTRQERKRVEAVGGKRHKGSGSRANLKSDGSVGYRWRMENKFTTASSYRVSLADLHKLRSECINGQAPVFNVDFQDLHTGATKEAWVLIPFSEWKQLVNDSPDD